MAVTYRRLGRHGVLVSNLCLGTMNFGTQTPEKDAFAIMDRALELGINFFDAADAYGGTRRGLTEEILGRWFSQGGGQRDAVVLATKVYNPADRPEDRAEPNHSGGNLSAVKIRRHCEGSLRRLRTETIDLY
jgi:aryl-alcohol dehydrogenase-like predicted oxidoreductase